MALSDQEKELVAQALNLYIQQASMQLPPQSAQQVAQIAQGIMDKLDTLDSGTSGPGKKPAGISDEWFENVCVECKFLDPGGSCTNKITEKFPGKCDPILLYERNKPDA